MSRVWKEDAYDESILVYGYLISTSSELVLILGRTEHHTGEAGFMHRSKWISTQRSLLQGEAAATAQRDFTCFLASAQHRWGWNTSNLLWVMSWVWQCNMGCFVPAAEGASRQTLPVQHCCHSLYKFLSLCGSLTAFKWALIQLMIQVLLIKQIQVPTSE